MRVAFVLRSVEVQPLFRDLCKACNASCLPLPTHPPLDPDNGSHNCLQPPSIKCSLLGLCLALFWAGRKPTLLHNATQQFLSPVVGWCPCFLVWFNSRHDNNFFCRQLQLFRVSNAHPGICFKPKALVLAKPDPNQAKNLEHPGISTVFNPESLTSGYLHQEGLDRKSVV